MQTEESYASVPVFVNEYLLEAARPASKDGWRSGISSTIPEDLSSARIPLQYVSRRGNFRRFAHRVCRLDDRAGLAPPIQRHFFQGQNVASLGALGSGFRLAPDGAPHPVHSTAGWAQLAVPITSRLTFDP